MLLNIKGHQYIYYSVKTREKKNDSKNLTSANKAMQSPELSKHNNSIKSKIVNNHHIKNIRLLSPS